MKVDSGSSVVKRCFGKFLKKSRLATGWSEYDVGYMLGRTHAMVGYWEQGTSFPASIVLLKKLCLLYPNVPSVVKSIAADVLSRIGRKRRDEFLALIDEGHFVPPLKKKLTCQYRPSDRRDGAYKEAFGNYLRRERLGKDLSIATLARALQVSPHRYIAWESGTNFPQSVMVLALLDKFYGNTFDVLFGLCKRNGIHLSHGETRDVLLRRAEFSGTELWSKGKSKPEGWQRYLDRRGKKGRTL